MSSPDALPSASFAEIAEDLFLYASSQARAAEGLELFCARNPERNFGDALEAARRSGILAGELHAFFRRVGKHEDEIRDFLAGLLARDALTATETSRPPAERPARIIDPGYVSAATFTKAA